MWDVRQQKCSSPKSGQRSRCGRDLPGNDKAGDKPARDRHSAESTPKAAGVKATQLEQENLSQMETLPWTAAHLSRMQVVGLAEWMRAWNDGLPLTWTPSAEPAGDQRGRTPEGPSESASVT